MHACFEFFNKLTLITPFKYLQTLAVVEVPNLETAISSTGDQSEIEGGGKLKTSILVKETCST